MSFTQWIEYEEPWRAGPEELRKHPLVRIVGKDLSNFFLHGTHKKNAKTLNQAEKPDDVGKKEYPRLAMIGIRAEMNEFGAAICLSEPRQPQQALMFSQGRGRGLFVVILKSGTQILDLSHECSRAPTLTFGNEPKVLRFFTRPAVTDDLISWYQTKVSPGYKERYPDWMEHIRIRFDPESPEFDVSSWQENLIRFVRDKGWGGIRFADEILLTDRTLIDKVRLAKPKEIEAIVGKQAYPTKGSLFYNKPTDAIDEYIRWHKENT